MDFLELARKRFSCRSFRDKEVEREKIDLILEAGRVAPTARNAQPQRILVLNDEENLQKLSACTKYGWNAPTVLIICYDTEFSYKNRFTGKDMGLIDASIVTTHMMFEIESLGLGTTWIGAFNPDEVRKQYNIPDSWEIVALLPIGYPSEDAVPSSLHETRKSIEENVYWNKI